MVTILNLKPHVTTICVGSDFHKLAADLCFLGQYR